MHSANIYDTLAFVVGVRINGNLITEKPFPVAEDSVPSRVLEDALGEFAELIDSAPRMIRNLALPSATQSRMLDDTRRYGMAALRHARDLFAAGDTKVSAITQDRPGKGNTRVEIYVLRATSYNQLVELDCRLAAV